MFRSLVNQRSSFVSVCKRFASTEQRQYPLYELRWYTIAPEHYPSFLKLTEEKIHLRTEHSPLLGYWTTELGGLNEVVHIWGYESLVQRQRIRNTLGKAEEWNKEYMSKMRPMIQAQENALMIPMSDVTNEFPLTDEVDLPGYELEVLAIADDETGSPVQRNEHGANLVGRWKGIVGGYNGSVIQLWRYPSLEQLDSAIREPKGMLEEQQFNKVLSPTAFSPLY